MANDKQTPAPQQGEDIGQFEITLKLSLNEVQATLNQLGNGSHNQVRALIDKIADQTNPQIPKPAPVKADPEPAPAP